MSNKETSNQPGEDERSEGLREKRDKGEDHYYVIRRDQAKTNLNKTQQSKQSRLGRNPRHPRATTKASDQNKQNKKVNLKGKAQPTSPPARSIYPFHRSSNHCLHFRRPQPRASYKQSPYQHYQAPACITRCKPTVFMYLTSAEAATRTPSRRTPSRVWPGRSGATQPPRAS